MFLCYTTHLAKFRFSYTVNRNVQACEGALQGFIFESSFAYDTFQRFRIISSIEFGEHLKISWLLL